MAGSKSISPFISDMDMYLFGTGTHYDIYKKLGAHVCKKGTQSGVYFAVWAPNARAASVVGPFNNWDKTANPMSFLEDCGIFELFILYILLLLSDKDRTFTVNNVIQGTIFTQY